MSDIVLNVGVLLVLAWYVRRVAARLRSHDLAHLGYPHHPDVDRASVPPEALRFFDEHRLDQLGLRPLGVLRVVATERATAFSEIWTDSTHTLHGQLIWFRSQTGSRTRTKAFVSFISFPADASVIASLEVTPEAFGLTSGSRPSTEILRLPGARPAALLALHRRRAAASGRPLLPCPDLRSIAFLLERSSAVDQQWRLESGRLERTPAGLVRLSRRQCLWYVIAHDRALKIILRSVVSARTRLLAQRWPAIQQPLPPFLPPAPMASSVPAQGRAAADTPV